MTTVANITTRRPSGAARRIALTPTSNVRVRPDRRLSARQCRPQRRPAGQQSRDLLPAATLVVTDPVGSGKYDWKGGRRRACPIRRSSPLRLCGNGGGRPHRRADLQVDHRLSQARRPTIIVDIDATQYEVGDVFVGVDQNQFSQEFQLAYTGERLNAVAGLYYLKREYRLRTRRPMPTILLGPAVPEQRLPADGRRRAADQELRRLCQRQLRVVPNVRLSAGVRYTSETKDYFRTTIDLLRRSLPRSTRRSPSRRRRASGTIRRRWPASTGRRRRRRCSMRASPRASSRAASTAAPTRAAEATKYEPEKVWSYEAGFKTTIANQLRLNGAVFYNEYRDFQARVSGLGHRPDHRPPLAAAFGAQCRQVAHPGRRARSGMDPDSRPADRRPARLSRRQI